MDSTTFVMAIARRARGLRVLLIPLSLAACTDPYGYGSDNYPPAHGYSHKTYAPPPAYGGRSGNGYQQPQMTGPFFGYESGYAPPPGVRW